MTPVAPASARSATGSGSDPVGGTDEPAAAAAEERASTPPWQRSAAQGGADQQSPGAGAGNPEPQAGQGYASSAAAGASPGGSEATTTMTKPVGAEQSGAVGRAPVNFPGPGGRPASSGGSGLTGRRPGRGPRRASLQVKRVDPWSVLKLALVLSVAAFFIWLVAVGVLYGVLDGMRVWDSLNGTYNDLTGDATEGDLISAGRVFGVAAIVGAINIVLFTALATVGAFVYNVSADLAGGIELTLSERD
ncbi:DUF3566 domain-containing protein [Actinoalloteichus spitiensis]|uniref:DUF3566 domain-containing protein n=1 Tax=Actinoalloteichus spitiensis TaxID=252394 RepID=UPI0009FC8F55